MLADFITIGGFVVGFIVGYLIMRYLKKKFMIWWSKRVKRKETMKKKEGKVDIIHIENENE